MRNLVEELRGDSSCRKLGVARSLFGEMRVIRWVGSCKENVRKM